MAADAAGTRPRLAVRGSLQGFAWLAATATLGAATATAAIRTVTMLGDAGPEPRAVLAVAGGAAAVAAFLGAVAWLARHRPLAALVLAMAGLLAIRAAVVVGVDAPLISDWAYYHRLALGTLRGAPPVADVPMGYPILLGVAYRLGGVSIATGEALNVALSVAAAALLGPWTWLVAGGRAAALGVAVLAVTPSDAFFVALIGSEAAFSLALAAIVLGITITLREAVAGGPRRRVIALAVVTGVAVGLAAWVRTTAFVLLPALAVLPLLVLPDARRAASIALAVVTAAGVTLLPVVAWNAALTGRPSPSTSVYLGWQLYVGLNPESRGGYNDEDVRRVNAAFPGYETRAIGREYSEGTFDPASLQLAVRRDARAMELALARLAASPGALPALVPRKFHRVWSAGDYPLDYALDRNTRVPPQPAASLALHAASQVWWLGLLATGTWWYGRRWRTRPPPVEGLVVAAVLLPIAAALLVLEAQSRYHEPLVPLLAALAGMSLAGGWRSGPDAASPPGRVPDPRADPSPGVPSPSTSSEGPAPSSCRPATLGQVASSSSARRGWPPRTVG